MLCVDNVSIGAHKHETPFDFCRQCCELHLRLVFWPGGATESPLERVDIPGEGDLHAHALTLQLPLEGALKRGGIKLVLRTQAGQWLACSYQGSHHDIFINLEKVRLFDDRVC